MTATTNELILRNIAAIIRQERIKYVGIQATDVRDVIFLVQYIRAQHADVQFFTTTADLLLAHSDYVHALRGLIAASTYPLNLTAQALAHGKNERILFPNNEAQGYYNAVVFHLAEDSGADPDTKPLLDYGYPTSTHGSKIIPGIWISAVGQNGQLVPMYYVQPEWDQDNMQKSLLIATTRKRDSDETKAKEDIPNTPFIMPFLGYILILIASWVLVRVQNVKAQPSSIILFTMSMFMLLFVTFLFFILFLSDYAIVVPFILWAILACFAYGHGTNKHFGVACPHAPDWFFWTLFSSVFSFVAALIYAESSFEPGIQHSLWLERALFPSNGISPLLPLVLICIGTAAAGVTALDQARQREKLPLTSHLECFDKPDGMYWKHPNTFILGALALIGVIYGIAQSSWYPSLDGLVFHGVLLLLFSFGLGWSALALLQAHFSWRVIHPFLNPTLPQSSPFLYSPNPSALPTVDDLKEYRTFIIATYGGNLWRDFSREEDQQAQARLSPKVYQYVHNANRYLIRLRLTIQIQVILWLAFVLALMSYPFRFRGLFLSAFVVLGVMIAWRSVTIMTGLNRSDLISRVNDTEPSRLSPDFELFQQLALYVLPVLIGIVMQAPLLSSYVWPLLTSFAEQFRW